MDINVITIAIACVFSINIYCTSMWSITLVFIFNFGPGTGNFHFFILFFLFLSSIYSGMQSCVSNELVGVAGFWRLDSINMVTILVIYGCWRFFIGIDYKIFFCRDDTLSCVRFITRVRMVYIVLCRSIGIVIRSGDIPRSYPDDRTTTWSYYHVQLCPTH